MSFEEKRSGSLTLALQAGFIIVLAVFAGVMAFAPLLKCRMCSEPYESVIRREVNAGKGVPKEDVLNQWIKCSFCANTRRVTFLKQWQLRNTPLK
jgi:hypothetical protein